MAAPPNFCIWEESLLFRSLLLNSFIQLRFWTPTKRPAPKIVLSMFYSSNPFREISSSSPKSKVYSGRQKSSDGYISYMKTKLPINGGDREMSKSQYKSRTHIVRMSVFLAGMAMVFMACFVFYSIVGKWRNYWAPLKTQWRKTS